MERLWAPWRAAYILGETEAAAGCIFCVKPARGREHFAEDLMLCVTAEVSVMLNAFPYNNGHLLVAPRAHVARAGGLAGPAHDALFRAVTAAAGVLERVLGTDGINIGLNMGRVAGAGIADHAHVHLVPRWNGDTNFMPVVGETKVISQHLQETYAILLPHFAEFGHLANLDAGAAAADGADSVRSVHES
jgi:ATP adenylyltransferase